MKNKSGQITIFIIIAIVLVVGVVAFFILRDKISIARIPANIEPAYNAFLTCLEEYTEVGIDVLETQGGYIELPEFEPGSVHMPFSSQLNFVGNLLPYWYYVSGNGIEKTQVPSKSDMEEQLQEFIEERIRNCNFNAYYDEGFEIEFGEPGASVSISGSNVNVRLNLRMNVEKGDDSALINTHKISVSSKLGTLYNSAKKVYDNEQKNLFLEDYAIDTLRLYAPVDGVEITCSPKVWDTNEVFGELKEAVEVNTLALKSEGNRDEYFVVDLNVGEEVRFINSRSWPSTYEVLPSDGNLLIANPIGNQPGFEILGFCYVPYHFVYNMKYPVLVQIMSGEETFQFPMAVVVQGNKQRESLGGTASESEVELCKYMNTAVQVRTYDNSFNSVDAEISYECFGERCNIGTTSDGTLESEFPQCVNGYIIARAEGFETTKHLFSTINSGSVDVVLDKLYEMNVDLKLDGVSYDGEAMIYFVSDDGTKTIVYPEQKKVELSEGQYEIQVYIFKDSSIKLDKTDYEQCFEVPRSGIAGIFGMTEESCIEVEIPSQIISNVLGGGGKQEYYILESEMYRHNTIEIGAESLEIPSTLAELQDNYLIFEDKGLGVDFK